ncbi:MAG: hypothetical protein HC862_26150 [Scytonema sp. RU_4_4]|nr:hypothetical protein [Scytonema sp. RU_4_4]
MSDSEIKQTVREAEYAATSATGDATITITNYYYREDLRVTPVESADASLDEDIPCPYRGLFHFGPDDAEFFFGREVFVEKLVQATQTRNFIPVLGASGSGKSSVVLAGLVPKLQKEGHWKFTHFRPGSDPFHALAVALVPLYTTTQDAGVRMNQASMLAKNLDKNVIPLRHVFAYIQHTHPNDRVLLIADQFEELYTLCPDEAIRRRFLDTLLASFQYSTGKSPSSTVLVTTMRADFLGNALLYRPFADVLQNADIKLGSMNREELSQVIEKPAEKLGVTFQAGLVDRILDDVEDEPGNLPLLEFALTLLWERRTSKQLTHAAYEAIGEVQGALAKHADQNYGKLSPTEREQVRRIFIQLVRPGEGAEDTRRLATKGELGEVSWSLVKELADARLVVTSLNAASEETVEVVHEALIQNWSELRQWMTTDRDFRAWQEQLRTAVHQWEKTKPDEGALLRGAALADAQEKLQERREELSQAERDFIEASVALRDREKQEHERVQAEKVRLQRRAISWLSGGLVAALMAAGAAAWQWQQAEIAQINTITKSSEFLFGYNQQFDVLIEGLKAGKLLKRMLSAPANTRTEIVNILRQAISEVRERNRLVGHDNAVNSVSFSPDGKTLASASYDKTIKLWDVATGKQLKTLSGHSDGVHSVSFSPDGKTLASASSDYTIKLWNVVTGKQLNTLTGHRSTVNSVSFSPDGKTLASASADFSIKLWDVTTVKEHNTLTGHNDEIFSLSFSSDGKTLASASKDSIKLWDVATGQERNTLIGHSNTVLGISFSPDGKILASASFDKTIKLWDVATGKLLKTFTGHSDLVNSVSFSPDGKTLASASGDQTIKLWDVATGKQLNTLTGHRNAVSSVSFSPDGKILASASGDQTIKLWDVVTGKQIKTLSGHRYWVNSISFSRDGKTLASASGDYTIKLWDIATGKQLNTLTGHRSGVSSVSFSPDGKTLASASYDRTIKLWNVATGKLLKTLFGHRSGVSSVSFSPDGKTLASASYDRTIILWNLESDLWNLDLDNLLVRDCHWVRNYLQNNPYVNESDKHLCDDIKRLP